jgi:hypothetical protein
MAKSRRVLRRKNKSRRRSGGNNVQPNSTNEIKVEVPPVPTNMKETNYGNKRGGSGVPVEAPPSGVEVPAGVPVEAAPAGVEAAPTSAEDNEPATKGDINKIIMMLTNLITTTQK